MKTLPLALCLTAALALQGCTHYVWVKPNGDPATFNADNYTCKQRAVTQAPPVFQVYSPYPTYYGGDRIITHCRDHGMTETCRTHVEGAPYPPQPPQAVDLNSSTRDDLYNACMGAQGWVLQPVKDPE